MKKILKLDTVLTDFNDTPLQHEDQSALTLRKALLQYLGLAHLMGVSGVEELSLYFIGRKIGKAPVDGTVTLDIQDYNLLKKLVDTGKVTVNGQPQSIFKLVAAQQLRVLLDEAENDKDKP